MVDIVSINEQRLLLKMGSYFYDFAEWAKPAGKWGRYFHVLRVDGTKYITLAPRIV